MASFNRVVLVGNTTRDIELRYVGANQTAVTEIGLAVNDRRKNASGEWVEEVTFVDVTLWGRTAEVAGEYVGKGSQILIEGRLKLDQWDDKETGGKRSKLRVIGERMMMLGSSKQQSQRPQGSQPQGSQQAAPTGGNPEDEIPF